MEPVYGDSNVQYLIPETELQAYTHIDDNIHSDINTTGTQIAFGCCCDESPCCSEDCACITECSTNYKGGALSFIDNLIKDHHFTRAVFECNEVCTCGLLCPNRIVQRGLVFKLQVFDTLDRGFGVKAMEVVPKGSYVIDYAGDVLSQQEAMQRIKFKDNDRCNYLLTVHETFGAEMVTTFIDAAKFGNVSRFINHSCEPNLILHPVRVNSSVPRLALFAKHDVAIGEELSFAYGGEEGRREGASFEHWDHMQNRIPCKCRSKLCKGFLPAEPLSDISGS